MKKIEKNNQINLFQDTWEYGKHNKSHQASARISFTFTEKIQKGIIFLLGARTYRGQSPV